jgi:hypothetical protein
VPGPHPRHLSPLASSLAAVICGNDPLSLHSVEAAPFPTSVGALASSLAAVICGNDPLSQHSVEAAPFPTSVAARFIACGGYLRQTI